MSSKSRRAYTRAYTPQLPHEDCGGSSDLVNLPPHVTSEHILVEIQVAGLIREQREDVSDRQRDDMMKHTYAHIRV